MDFISLFWKIPQVYGLHGQNEEVYLVTLVDRLAIKIWSNHRNPRVAFFGLERKPPTKIYNRFFKNQTISI